MVSLSSTTSFKCCKKYGNKFLKTLYDYFLILNIESILTCCSIEVFHFQRKDLSNSTSANNEPVNCFEYDCHVLFALFRYYYYYSRYCFHFNTSVLIALLLSIHYSFRAIIGFILNPLIFCPNATVQSRQRRQKRELSRTN